MRDLTDIDNELDAERACLLYELHSPRRSPTAIEDEWRRIDALLDERLEAK